MSRFIWLCGPSAVGKTTLAMDRAKLIRVCGLVEPFFVQSPYAGTARNSPIALRMNPGFTAIVHVWQWRLHEDMLAMYREYPEDVSIYLVRPPSIDEYMRRYAAKYPEKVDDRLRDRLIHACGHVRDALPPIYKVIS